MQNHLSVASGMNEDRINVLELESHLATVTYGNFTLTDAVRPSFDLQIIPEQGYKYDQIKQKTTSRTALQRVDSRWLMPMLIVSISHENLFETFLDLLTPLGNTVNVVLEMSHRYSGAHRSCLRREHIDLPVLKSFLYDHEDMLLHDGCTGISVIAPKLGAEVRFDEHKLILIGAKSLLPFERILCRYGIFQNDAMKLLTDAEHIHITRDDYYRQLKMLQRSLGMDERYSTAR